MTTFDTDIWNMVQIQKLQMKTYHAGIIREQNAMHAAIELPSLNDARKFERTNTVDCGQL